ncbi:MAG TPA: glycosyltransferase [Thermoanaerobaculia bacterium]
MTTISIAIPTYGRDAVLVDTLRHVLDLDPRADEVLVIDQTPRHDDATERQLEEWEEQGAIRWVRLDAPSIPHAMNEALRRTTSDVVLFLDDDLIPSPGLVAAHRSAIERRRAEAVVGQILQPSEEPIAFADYERNRMEDLGFPFNANTGARVTNVMAGNLAVVRQRALAIGGFDENFTTTAYRFETDFAWRLLDAGGTIWFEPSASIRHLKADRGGLRVWGDHLRSASPAHSTGDYYFALMNLPRASRVGYFARRLRRNAFSRFDVTHPWWIPVKVVREARALVQAIALARRGRATMA